jgi:hypothetical protein
MKNKNFGKEKKKKRHKKLETKIAISFDMASLPLSTGQKALYGPRTRTRQMTGREGEREFYESSIVV